MKPLEAVKKYGSLDKHGRIGMYYTLELKPNSAGLFLSVGDTSVAVRNIDGTLIAEWDLGEITRRFNRKVKNVLLVKARVEERDRVEYFLFYRARLLTGGASPTILKGQFESGRLLLDLRLHDQGTMARNHGTGFRMHQKDLEDFYQNIEEVEF